MSAASPSSSSQEELQQISYADFAKIDLRVGKIIAADPFPEARNPAFKLTIDFGPLGIKRSSAQITKRYQPEELIGRFIIAVVNFPSKQIATMKSEVLVLGAVQDPTDVVLLRPDFDVPLGTRIA